VDYRITSHLLQRMKLRGVEREDLDHALSHIVATWPTPKDSTCITGRTSDGRLLTIWIVGDHWPQAGTITIKSTAWKDEA
jgi:hypothetical protein